MIKSKLLICSAIVLSLSTISLKSAIAEDINSVNQEQLISQMEMMGTKKLVGQVTEIKEEVVTVKKEDGEIVKLKVPTQMQEEMDLQVGANIVADLVGSQEGDLWLISDISYQTAATMTEETTTEETTTEEIMDANTGVSETETITETVTDGETTMETETTTTTTTTEVIEEQTEVVEEQPAPVRALW